MMGSAARRRAWTGPAFWSFGFRPFFLFAALWAASAMAMWIAMLSGWQGPPTRFSAIDWHAHEMLFGYLPAAMAGFLLTAVPNWTGRYPIMGWPLAGLFATWVVGRVAVLTSLALSPILACSIDLLFLVTLVLAIAREIIAGKNWRNLKVLALITALAVANGVFHVEALSGAAASGLGARGATAIAIMLITLIGGRIIPSFTRNWLAKHARTAPDPAPFGRFDIVALTFSFIALAAWVVLSPDAALVPLTCVIAGLLNAVRLVRWRGWRTYREPLVWILHIGFAFVPVGFILLAASAAIPELIDARAAQHAFMAGAVGIMTLAVMTRASLGHSGRDLHAGPAITSVFISALVSAVLRVASGISGAPTWFLQVAAITWIAAFAGFVVIYAPILLQRRSS